MRRSRRWHRSLRARGYVAVIAVVVAPLAIVLAASVVDRVEGASDLARVRSASKRAAGACAGMPPGPSRDRALVAAAKENKVRLRLVNARGEVAGDHDFARDQAIRDRIGDLFFGPEGAPSLAAWERGAPALTERPHVRDAMAGRASSGCARALEGSLAVCASATPLAGGGAAVAERGSPRAIRAFYDLRYPLLKLTLYVLGMGALFAWWLGRRIVRPIEALRDDVIDRAGSPASATPLAPRSDDEIGDLASSFNALLTAIDARNKANEAFAADLVHELKSPIAAIRAASEALAKGSIDEARAARIARALDASGARLDALVTRFLELARAEAGLAGEARTTFDLGALTRGVAGAVRDAPRSAGVRFDVAVEEVLLEGVMASVEDAIRNVIENAASFAAEGAAEPWVRVSVRREGAMGIVDVTDSGPGIAEDKLPKVFDRFFSERRAGGGTGLGLALAKAIVEAHQGTIAASSKPGEGATFTLRLPVSHGVHTPSAGDSPDR